MTFKPISSKISMRDYKQLKEMECGFIGKIFGFNETGKNNIALFLIIIFAVAWFIAEYFNFNSQIFSTLMTAAGGYFFRGITSKD
ncbi:MAG: hypothetical protein PHN56_00505 [Candidatus Nanoarchaeia archaeon]|nr:hypothetical protein [Candidatus Nanoarchaeia archaeon]